MWGAQIQKIQERKNTLRKALRPFYPIIENLRNDLTYLSSFHSRASIPTNQRNNIIASIKKGFSSFEQKYAQLRTDGLEPELEITKKELSDMMKWIFNTWRLNGTNVFHSNLQLCITRTQVCENLLEEFLKS